MSSSTEPGEAKDLNLSLCIICGQIKPKERLVKNPTSHDRALMCLQKWASYGHLEYFESWSKLKTFTAQKLEDKGASWHRLCSSGIRTSSIGSYIAIAHRFSTKRGTARSLSRGEGTHIHYLYGYVPPNGVVILKVSISDVFSRTGYKNLWITALSSA